MKGAQVLLALQRVAARSVSQAKGNLIRVKNVKKKSRSTSGVSAAQRGAHTELHQRAGAATWSEILSQPETWSETARRFESSTLRAEIPQVFSAQRPWLFVACGSSYYLARIVAAQWSKLLNIGCTAVPASELLFAPDETLARTGAKQVVLISRSGKTTEVLRAAKLLNSRDGIRSLGVTCNERSELVQFCTLMMALPCADEKSMVMTRSFTSILLLFARIAAIFLGDNRLTAAIDALPAKAAAWLKANADKIRALGAKRGFGDFVFLGQGAHYWLAQEAALKLTEMSSSYAQAYHTLEFRHGPKAIASPDTLITFLLSDAAAEEETPLVSEVKQLGAATMVVANRATAELRNASDLLVELESQEPEFVRLALAALPAHLLGLAVGLRKGLDPDTPKNLTRAVVLGGDNGASAVAARKRRAD